MRNAIQRSHLKLDVLYHTLFLLCGWVKLTIFVQRDFPFVNEDSLSDTLVFSAPIFFLSLMYRVKLKSSSRADEPRFSEPIRKLEMNLFLL